MKNEAFPSKRSHAVLLFVIAGLTVGSSCSKEKDFPETDLANQTRVFISGSAAVMPLLKTLAHEFSHGQPDVKIIFPPDAHSEAGIAGVIEEEYDIGAVSRGMMPEERQNQIRYLHLATDGLVFITNTNVNISNLNTDQIRDIFLGKINNWSQVGGEDAAIAVVDRPDHTSAKIAFRQTFLGSDLAVTPNAVIVQRPWQITSSIRMIPNSVGYTSLGEIIMENPLVNIISVNGVRPTPEKLGTGEYKFFRPFGLVVGPHPKTSTMKFINFIFSDDGSRVIEKSGYIPQLYEIVIGIVPEQNLMVQNQRYKPLEDYLSRKLDQKFPVRLKLFPTYIEVCRALAEGEINAAFLGSLAYTAVRKYVDVLARPDYGGVSTYRGLLFVRAGSGIETLQDMRGKRLVLGGRTTTAGYVFPLFYFRKHGIPDYQDFFSNSFFVGTHEDAILAVIHNQADVGAAKDLIFNVMVRENPALSASVKILAESPPVPSNAFVMRKGIEFPCFECHQRIRKKQRIDEELQSSPLNLTGAIKEALLKMSEDPDGGDALKAIGDADRFIETTDADYAELYKMLREIQVNPEDLLSGALDDAELRE